MFLRHSLVRCAAIELKPILIFEISIQAQSLLLVSRAPGYTVQVGYMGSLASAGFLPGGNSVLRETHRLLLGSDVKENTPNLKSLKVQRQEKLPQLSPLS